MTKIALAGMAHETNTFSDQATDLAEFEANGIFSGQNLGRLAGTNTVIGGVWDAAALDASVEIDPIIATSAIPGGLVTRQAFDSIVGAMVQGLVARPPDAVVLDLHGAMVTEFDDDGDAAILQRVRDAVGPAAPIVAVLDLHANIGPRMVELADALIPYDTYPHIDNAARGAQALDLALRAARGEIKLVMAEAKLPILPPGPRQYSGVEPTVSIMAHGRLLEEQAGVLNVGVCFAFPYADCPFPGMTVLVLTDDDPELAKRVAIEMKQLIWDRREDFMPPLRSVEEAVHAAIAAPEGPIVLADLGDNPGGGTPADGTSLLWALLDLGARNAALALIADPAAVALAQRAGVGAEVQLELGGKTDDKHGFPVPVVATVQHLSQGDFIYEGPMEAGVKGTLGPTAVLACQGRHGGVVEVIVSTRRVQPFDAAVFRSQGIEPTEKKILVVKSAVHFRGSFTPIAREIIEVNTPGLTSIDFTNFPYQKLARPIWPLDPI